MLNCCLTAMPKTSPAPHAIPATPRPAATRYSIDLLRPAPSQPFSSAPFSAIRDTRSFGSDVGSTSARALREGAPERFDDFDSDRCFFFLPLPSLRDTLGSSQSSSMDARMEMRLEAAATPNVVLAFRKCVMRSQELFAVRCAGARVVATAAAGCLCCASLRARIAVENRSTASSMYLLLPTIATALSVGTD